MGLDMSPKEIAQTYRKWNKGELNSYLIEISAEVLDQIDPETGAALVDVIMDKAGQKGTGLWTAVSALASRKSGANYNSGCFCKKFVCPLRKNALLLVKSCLVRILQ